MRSSLVRFSALAAVALLFAGCGGSSHRIATVNGKTSAKFSNKSVSQVIEVLTKSFGPMKGFKAEIPGDLKNTKINLEFADVSTIEPVRKKLADATGYDVEVDAAKKTITFKKKS